MDFLMNTTHLHITTWVVAIVLFVIAALGGGKSKGLHMGLRLFYILVIISGGALFYATMGLGMGMLYGFKFLAGIAIIGVMEMTLVRQKKGKATSTFWIVFAILLFVLLFLGFKLPMGFNFLA